MDRIRVLYVITRLELGGAQRVVLELAGGLDPARFEVALAWGPGEALDGEARALDGVQRFEIESLIRPVRPRLDLIALAAIRGVIRSFRPDIVHTHSSKAGVLGRAAASGEGVRAVVHTIHGWGFTPLQRFPVRAAFFAAERLAARWTDRFVAVSEVNRRRGVELGLFAAEDCELIRAGVRLARLQGVVDDGTVRARLAIPSGVPVVIQIGNFKPQKGPLDFVRVAARVARARRDVHFVMLGDGPLRPEAEALATSLGIAKRIRFPGWWNDVPGLLATTAVSVLTSRHEGLPCSVVESLAAGVPTVATAVDGTPEVIRHGVNGLLNAAGDVVGLAESVIRVLTDGDLRLRLAAAAPSGLEAFETDTMIRQHQEMYAWLTVHSRF